MTRIIKFRAWDKERKEMLSPDRICHLDGDTTKGLAQSSPFLILMQFTGLVDKNGKEIYEGDIIKWNTKSLPIFWSDKVITYLLGKPEACHTTLRARCPYYEVLGNIYENPEIELTEEI